MEGKKITEDIYHYTQAFGAKNVLFKKPPQLNQILIFDYKLYILLEESILIIENRHFNI